MGKLKVEIRKTGDGAPGNADVSSADANALIRSRFPANKIVRTEEEETLPSGHWPSAFPHALTTTALQRGREFLDAGAGERDALERFEVRRVGNLAHGFNEAMRYWTETNLQIGENGLLAALEMAFTTTLLTAC